MKFKQWLILYILCSASSVYAEVIQIDAQQLKSLIKAGVTVIDLRTPSEWDQTGIVEGSLPIMFFDERRQPQAKQWMHKVAQIVTPDDELILICRTGNRSNMVGNYLVRQHDFRRVYNVSKGIKDWIAQGNKTIRVAQQSSLSQE